MVDCLCKLVGISALTYNHPLLLKSLNLGNDAHHLSVSPRVPWHCSRLALCLVQPLLSAHPPCSSITHNCYTRLVSSLTPDSLVFEWELPGLSTLPSRVLKSEWSGLAGKSPGGCQCLCISVMGITLPLLVHDYSGIDFPLDSSGFNMTVGPSVSKRCPAVEITL